MRWKPHWPEQGPFRNLMLVASALTVLWFMREQPRVMGGLLMAALAVSLVMTFEQHLRQQRFSMLRSGVRVCRICRQALGAPSALKVMYLALMAGFLGILSIGMTFDLTPEQLDPWLIGLSIVLTVAGTLDAAQLVWRMTRFAWARTAGKLLLSGIALLSGWFSAMLTDQVLGQATGLNPGDLTYSATMLKGLLTPVVYVQLCVLCLGALATLAYVLIFTAATVRQILGFVMQFFSLDHRQQRQKTSVGYRLVFGKNRPAFSLPRWFDGTSLVPMFRPAAILMACSSAVVMLSPLVSVNGWLQPRWVSAGIVALDFHARHSCTTVPLFTRVHYLDKDEVLVATATPGGWRFETASCRKA